MSQGERGLVQQGDVVGTILYVVYCRQHLLRQVTMHLGTGVNIFIPPVGKTKEFSRFPLTLIKIKINVLTISFIIIFLGKKYFRGKGNIYQEYYCPCLGIEGNEPAGSQDKMLSLSLLFCCSQQFIQQPADIYIV